MATSSEKPTVSRISVEPDNGTSPYFELPKEIVYSVPVVFRAPVRFEVPVEFCAPVSFKDSVDFQKDPQSDQKDQSR